MKTKLLLIVSILLITGCINHNYKMEKLVNCINSKNGMLYYSSSVYSWRWMGPAWENLSKFDCDKNKDVCRALGVKTPAWRVNNTIVEGDLKFEELNLLYNCKISEK